jgi:hypothetical protein
MVCWWVLVHCGCKLWTCEAIVKNPLNTSSICRGCLTLSEISVSTDRRWHRAPPKWITAMQNSKVLLPLLTLLRIWDGAILGIWVLNSARHLLLRVPVPRTALFKVLSFLTLHFTFWAKLKITKDIPWECLQALDPKVIPVLLLAKCSHLVLLVFTATLVLFFLV